MDRVKPTSFQTARNEKRHLWSKNKVKGGDLEEPEVRQTDKVGSVCSVASQVTYEPGQKNKSRLPRAENESISSINRVVGLTLSYLLIY